MEKLPLQLYNLSEWFLMRSFRVVTGLRLAFNPELEKIYLIALGNVEEKVVNIIRNQVLDEFGVKIELLEKEVDYKRVRRGHFINVTRLARKFNKEIMRDKEVALLGVSNYWLAPTNFLLSQIIHTIQPILGITYLKWGICFLTTLDGYLSDDLIEFAAIHEVGHLIGKHGYPLAWLQKRRKANKK